MSLKTYTHIGEGPHQAWPFSPLGTDVLKPGAWVQRRDDILVADQGLGLVIAVTDGTLMVLWSREPRTHDIMSMSGSAYRGGLHI